MKWLSRLFANLLMRLRGQPALETDEVELEPEKENEDCAVVEWEDEESEEDKGPTLH